MASDNPRRLTPSTSTTLAQNMVVGHQHYEIITPIHQYSRVTLYEKGVLKHVQNEHERIQHAEQRRCDDSIRRDRDHGLSKGGEIDREHDAIKQIRESSTRRVKASRPVPAKEDN